MGSRPTTKPLLPKLQSELLFVLPCKSADRSGRSPTLSNTHLGIHQMAVVLILCCTTLILLVILVIRNHRAKQTSIHNWKPIPQVEPCLPFFGNALHIDTTNFHLALSELRQTYGPVYYIKLFNEKILVLNDYASIYDALVVKGSDFAGRPSMYRTSQADRNKHSIVWQTYTKRLMFLRKSVQKCLKMYGSGLEKLEERCAPDIHQVCEKFKQTNGKAFDPRNSVYESVCSVMLYLTLGTRFDYGSPVFQSVREMNELFNDTFGSGKGKQLDFVPLLWLFQADGYSRMQRALQLRDELWHEQLNKMKTCKVDPDCIVQTLLDQTDSAGTDTASASSPSLPSSSGCIMTAKEVFTNLILAGTDTTSTSLCCLLLILCHYPDIQQRLQQDVDRVLGPHDSPCLAHRSRLPYVEAVLMELLRYISHVPLAVPHFTMRDTSVLGSPVPANTTVFINLWSLHHDKTEWNDPWRFDPSRFLDDRGQLVSPSHENRRRLLPFGAGRRVCLGEVLAKNRLFLFVVSLVQQFHFEPEDREHLPEVDPRTYEMGLVIHPKPFQLRAMPRNSVDHML